MVVDWGNIKMDLPRLDNQVEAYLWHRLNSQEGHGLELAMGLNLLFLTVVAFGMKYDKLMVIMKKEEERERKKKEEGKKEGAAQ